VPTHLRSGTLSWSARPKEAPFGHRTVFWPFSHYQDLPSTSSSHNASTGAFSMFKLTYMPASSVSVSSEHSLTFNKLKIQLLKHRPAYWFHTGSDSTYFWPYEANSICHGSPLSHYNENLLWTMYKQMSVAAFQQNLIYAERQWLTPVIPATQEAEIRRIAVRSQSRQIACKTLSQKNPTQKKGWWSGSRCRSWVPTPALQKKPTKLYL
jgi:hypothetical protein